MTRLYYSPHGYGTAAFIAAYIAAESVACEVIEPHDPTQKTKSDTVYCEVNKRCSLPCLVLNDGSVLTAEPTILAFMVDKSLNKSALCSSVDRYQIDQFMFHLAVDLNGPIDELSMPNNSESVIEKYRTSCAVALTYLEKDLVDTQRIYAVGDTFSIADVYLYTVMCKADTAGLASCGASKEEGHQHDPPTNYPKLTEYWERIDNREDIKGAIARMSSNPDTTFDKTPSKCAWFECDQRDAL